MSSAAATDAPPDGLADLLPLMGGALRVLAVLFRYPDPAIYHALSETLPLCDELAVQAIGRPLVLPSRSELEVEYTSLFLAAPHGVPAPPYLSCHLDQEGLVGGEAARLVREMMEAEGVLPAGDGNEPFDHLPLVLELAALLAERSGRQAGRGARLTSLQDLVAGLLQPALNVLAPALSAARPESLYLDGALLCRSLVEAVDLLCNAMKSEKEWAHAV